MYRINARGPAMAQGDTDRLSDNHLRPLSHQQLSLRYIGRFPIDTLAAVIYRYVWNPRPYADSHRFESYEMPLCEGRAGRSVLFGT